MPAPLPDRLEVHIAGPADLQLVEALARLRLAARRCGATLAVRADGELAGLLDVIGLQHALDEP